MDFFSQQERARRNTRYLVVLFALATLLIIVLVNVLVTALVWFTGDYNLYVGGSGWDGYLRAFSWDRSLTVAMVVGSTIGLVSMVRWMQLSSGGKTVAQSLGGRRIKGFSDDPYEQRCLNVVEELALAANMPVPALYVLPSERGINAFAAGQGTADAVVAVTRGTLLQLNREELQGVIGHEFSHILNGDMRLGIRLAALLKGITFIGDVGHFLLRVGAYSGGNRRDNRGAALPWCTPPGLRRCPIYFSARCATTCGRALPPTPRWSSAYSAWTKSGMGSSSNERKSATARNP